jgi:uncharacterized protein (TIGR02231 family)
MVRTVGWLCVLLLVTTCAYAELLCESTIERVTVFTDKAEITRTGEAEVGAGIESLLVEVPAYQIDTKSIQARVFGAGEVFSVQFENVYVEEAPQEKVAELEAMLEKKTDARKELHSEKWILKKKETYLDAVITPPAIDGDRALRIEYPEAEDITAMLSTLEDAFSAVAARTLTIDKKIRDLDKEIARIEKELGSLRNPSSRKKGYIKVAFDSKKEQTVRLSISYLAYRASWTPFYKVNVAEDMSTIDLQMFASVRQMTGEDWQDCMITVSNVVPMRSVRLPRATDWTLDIPRAYRRDKEKSLMRAAAPMALHEDISAADGYGGAMEPEPAPAEFQQAEARQLPLAFEYDFDGAITIESQEKETLLPLFNRQVTGRYFYYAVPRQTQQVFLVTEIESAEELLAAQMSINFADRYVGTTYLPAKKAGESFELNLGVDRAVVVERTVTRDTVKETAFFGKMDAATINRELQITIDIENRKNKPIALKVYDAVPVSRTDKIVVKDLVVTPPPREEDIYDQEGVYEWMLSVEPGTTEEISIGFSVQYPKDIQPVGL